MSLSYNFHLGNGDNGNVFQVVNNLDSTRSATFQYDLLNRLAQANTVTTTGANCWGEVYTIDTWSNLTNRSGPAGMSGCSTELLNTSASTNNRLSGLTYDLAGNVTNDGNGNSPAYDSENRMVTDAGVTYSYDANGNRMEKSSGTLYWFGTGGEILAESNLSGTINEEYIFFNGKRLARVDRPSGTVHYYFSDHLGSSSVITDALGNVQQQYFYYPYGGTVAQIGSDTNHYKFTGKERDSESGLDEFGARYYASTQGRFMIPDWAARPTTVPYAAFGDPQSLNLYGYVRNNPLSRSDPDGHDALAIAAELSGPLIECPICEGILWGGALGLEAYGIYKLSQHGKGGRRGDDFANTDDEELSKIARTKNDPRRQRAKEEEKGRKLRRSRQNREVKKTPQPDKPEPDQPKPDQPKPDQPKPDQPKPDQPKPDQPKPEQLDPR